MYSVQKFLEDARKFYGMTRTHRNQRTQLNLYPDYPEYIEYIRYYTISLMDSITDQIQGETGKAADCARSHCKRIRQLIRSNEAELYGPDEDGSEDEGEDEDEEPIYFTTEKPCFGWIANNMRWLKDQAKVEEDPKILKDSTGTSKR